MIPPQGCDLAAPGDKLYSSATRKTYRWWPGLANSFLSLNLTIKMNTTYDNFTPLCFHVLFWRLRSKIAQIQTIKIFRRSNVPLSLRSFLVASFYTLCSVHEKCNNLAGVPWKRGTGASFLLFVGQDNKKFTSSKIHFQILLMWQQINQSKCETHVLLFTSICYERKHVSDLSMLAFCFRSQTFVVYLRTTKVHSNQRFQGLALHYLLRKSDLWNPHAFGFPIVNTPPMPSEFHNREPPLSFGNPKSRP